MSEFDKREDAFERQFAHDEELRFKALARRNKLLGLWAADKLGLTGSAAESYAKALVTAGVEDMGEDDLVRKLRADFAAKNVVQSEHQIRRAMTDLLDQAIAAVKAGT